MKPLGPETAFWSTELWQQRLLFLNNWIKWQTEGHYCTVTYPICRLQDLTEENSFYVVVQRWNRTGKRKNNISCFSNVIKSEDNSKLPWIELTYLRDTTDRRRHLCHNDWCPNIINFSSERTKLCQMIFLILRYMLYCTVKMVIVEMSLTIEKYDELSSVFLGM